MTPYKLSKNVIIDLDHLADVVWLEATVDRRWLRVSLTTGTYHELIGVDAERLWQYLLSRTPEAAEASALGRLVDAYVTLVGGMGPAVDDPDRFTVRVVDIGHVRNMMKAAKADLEQRST